MFITHTHHSEMAEDFRETENRFEEMTDYRLKMVEKAEHTVGDILSDGDPWQGQNCTREKCWLCETEGENWQESEARMQQEKSCIPDLLHDL